MSEIYHGSRSQLAADRLREMIVAGELLPGQRVSEREIIEVLDGFSRTPLREALKMLAAEGLVTISPNCGATVRAFSMREVDDIIELTAGLESIAAERACTQASDEEIAHIAKLTRSMRECFLENRLMEYFEINQNIHRLIVDAARNEEMARVYVGECARIKRFRYAGNHHHDRWDSAMSEHEQIVLALKARNGPLLREMVLAHHRNGWQVSRTLLAEELSGTANGVLADAVGHSRSAKRTGTS